MEQITLNDETHDVQDVSASGYLPRVRLLNGHEYYVAETHEIAGEAASKYWRDLAETDPKEFASLIGEERVVQWAMNQSDSFGICNAEEFFDRVGDVPEEEFGRYDGHEIEGVTLSAALAQELDLEDADPQYIVAYRQN